MCGLRPCAQPRKLKHVGTYLQTGSYVVGIKHGASMNLFEGFVPDSIDQLKPDTTNKCWQNLIQQIGCRILRALSERGVSLAAYLVPGRDGAGVWPDSGIVPAASAASGPGPGLRGPWPRPISTYKCQCSENQRSSVKYSTWLKKLKRVSDERLWALRNDFPVFSM